VSVHADHLGRERKKDDREYPREVHQDECGVVGAHVLDEAVMVVPKAADHGEAQKEHQQRRPGLGQNRREFA
jgi:hypothetical protein